MEAFMYRFHPQWIESKRLVDEGESESCDRFTRFSLTTMTTRVTFVIRQTLAVAACSTLDAIVSRFPVSFWRAASEGCRRGEERSSLESDRLASGLLDFGSGTSSFTCSTQLSRYQRVQILGTDGRIEIEIPFNAPLDQETRLWIDRDGEIEDFVFPICDQYALQGEAFSRAVLENTPVPTPLSDAIENMTVIDAVFRSGIPRWVELPS